MQDFIILAILIVVIVLAARYVYKAKKSGRKCIGCPEGCCPSKAQGGCSCSCSCGEHK